jgi:hypothetical protein
LTSINFHGSDIGVAPFMPGFSWHHWLPNLRCFINFVRLAGVNFLFLYHIFF